MAIRMARFEQDALHGLGKCGATAVSALRIRTRLYLGQGGD